MSLIDFKGKNIIVTGAASGIGRCTAELLTRLGASITALDRNDPENSEWRFHRIDMSNPIDIDRVVAQIKLGKIDGLCNIAGLPGTADDLLVHQVNYLGLRHLTMSLLPRLAKGSAIVNLASMAGFLWRERSELLWELANINDWAQAETWIKDHPVMFDQAYRKSKEAVIVWMLANATKWNSERGVRMNCVSPAPVMTPIFDDFKQSLGQANVQDIIDRTGRPALPDDIAPVIAFLLSDASRWVVGVDLPTEGGLTASRFVSSMTS